MEEFATETSRLSVFAGMFKEGKEDGQGRLQYDGGQVYEGEWVGDAMKGKGKMIWPDRREY